MGRMQAIWWDFVERAGWTAAQQFFATLLTTSAATVAGLPWKLALTMAAGAALVSVLATAIQYLSKKTDLTFWPDLIVRLVKTFIASIAASLGADAVNVFDFDWSGALNVAVLATLGALGKGLLARQSQSDLSAEHGEVLAPPTPSTLPTPTYIAATR